jgi:hypothetical protein
VLKCDNQQSILLYGLQPFFLLSCVLILNEAMPSFSLLGIVLLAIAILGFWEMSISLQCMAMTECFYAEVT